MATITFGATPESGYVIYFLDASGNLISSFADPCLGNIATIPEDAVYFYISRGDYVISAFYTDNSEGTYYGSETLAGTTLLEGETDYVITGYDTSWDSGGNATIYYFRVKSINEYAGLGRLQ